MSDERRGDKTNDVSGAAGAVVQAASIAGGVHLHTTRTSPIPPPHELPPDVHAFTDRVQQLAEMDLMLASTEETSSTAAVVISAVSGTAGVGKTAFATHWAHRVSDRFPDGQLYLNLRGYGPDEPVPPAAALASLLRSLGVPNTDIPHDLDERAARFRSLAAGRRMLIVLDNARSADQVRPLLPGTSSCLVLVTSRDALPGLVSRDGARRVNLDLLPHDQARYLLRMLIGPRVDTEPEAVDSLVRHCARLPLALRIAADLVTDNPQATLAELVRELADEQGRLDMLDAGDDPYTAVRAVLSWSYRNLDPEQSRAFRLLGLHPGRDFDPVSAAVLFQTPAARGRRLLDSLVRAHLLERTTTGRYQMHDLLRVYAADLASQEEPEESRHAASGRLFNFFLRTASQAMDILFPQEHDRRPKFPTDSESPANLVDDAQAVRWLETERATLAAVAAHTTWTTYATSLSATLYRFLDVHGHFDDAVTLHSLAVTAARQRGDKVSEGRASHNLGVVYQRLGRYLEAQDHLTRAITVLRQAGSPLVEALALADLGHVHMLLGRQDEALACDSAALRLFEEVGDRTGQGQVLNNMGLVLDRLGRHEESVEHMQRALALFRKANDRPRIGYVLNDIGVAFQHLERNLEAKGYHQEALELARATRDRALEAEALNGLGNALRRTGMTDEVLACHEQALAIALDIGDRHEQAQAHEGFANAHEASRDVARARDRWGLALDIYLELGAPEAVEVRRRLDRLIG
ncbi:tetratricopeptide repeat protein [Saccharothrix sp. 6-C]|uniref:ATP-binding protein n=1 Tax=Saccharothrix sp. 6-C TaxID=2781735 RepID=UPI0019175417|nr:tetratricopeptide repeat protein [Saccharothrix sp. 6-C]QQQ77474.1 tetratricopeptide repeat protein [Saccharothrix sp. 6-C]